MENNERGQEIERHGRNLGEKSENSS